MENSFLCLQSPQKVFCLFALSENPFILIESRRTKRHRRLWWWQRRWWKILSVNMLQLGAQWTSPTSSRFVAFVWSFSAFDIFLNISSNVRFNLLVSTRTKHMKPSDAAWKFSTSNEQSFARFSWFNLLHEQKFSIEEKVDQPTGLLSRARRF